VHLRIGCAASVSYCPSAGRKSASGASSSVWWRCSSRIPCSESGRVEFEIRGLALEALGIEFGANLMLKSKLRFNPKQKANHTDQLVFTLRDGTMRTDDRKLGGWWLNASSQRFSVYATEPPRFEGTLGVRARDLQPVLDALADRNTIHDLIPKFTHLSDFQSRSACIRRNPRTEPVLLRARRARSLLQPQ
jgi:hypothetical protein